MAETIKQNIAIFKVPEVGDENWRDDIDVDYATYGNERQEREYISSAEVSKESIDKIKARKIGRVALFNTDNKFAA